MVLRPYLLGLGLGRERGAWSLLSRFFPTDSEGLVSDHELIIVQRSPRSSADSSVGMFRAAKIRPMQFERRALVAAAAAAVSPLPAQRKARAETIKNARESARTGQRDAAAARRAAHKRRRGPLFASPAADPAGSVRAVKEARVLGRGVGGANVVRVLATQGWLRLRMHF